MPAPNIIQLRQLLSEKFPGLRTRADEFSTATRPCWPSGFSQMDQSLRGGLPKGALTEVVAGSGGSGSASLGTSILRHALREQTFVAVIDGQDSLDVTQINEDLARLLWVRCRSAEEALKAADLLLRDGNIPVVLLDLGANPAAQLRKIPATVWYRFQRLVEQTSAVCIVFTPRAMVAPAQARITLHSRFGLDALEREQQTLMQELKCEISEARRFEESAKAVPSSA